jgi:predicted DNA-binding transcriptional regulator
MVKKIATTVAMRIIALLIASLLMEVFCASLKMNAFRLEKFAMIPKTAQTEAMKAKVVQTKLMIVVRLNAMASAKFYRLGLLACVTKVWCSTRLAASAR